MFGSVRVRAGPGASSTLSVSTSTRAVGSVARPSASPSTPSAAAVLSHEKGPENRSRTSSLYAATRESLAADAILAEYGSRVPRHLDNSQDGVGSDHYLELGGGGTGDEAEPESMIVQRRLPWRVKKHFKLAAQGLQDELSTSSSAGGGLNRPESKDPLSVDFNAYQPHSVVRRMFQFLERESLNVGAELQAPGRNSNSDPTWLGAGNTGAAALGASLVDPLALIAPRANDGRSALVGASSTAGAALAHSPASAPARRTTKKTEAACRQWNELLRQTWRSRKFLQPQDWAHVLKAVVEFVYEVDERKLMRDAVVHLHPAASVSSSGGTSGSGSGITEVAKDHDREQDDRWLLAAEQSAAHSSLYKGWMREDDAAPTTWGRKSNKKVVQGSRFTWYDLESSNRTAVPGLVRRYRDALATWDVPAQVHEGLLRTGARTLKQRREQRKMQRLAAAKSSLDVPLAQSIVTKALEALSGDNTSFDYQDAAGNLLRSGGGTGNRNWCDSVASGDRFCGGGGAASITSVRTAAHLLTTVDVLEKCSCFFLRHPSYLELLTKIQHVQAAVLQLLGEKLNLSEEADAVCFAYKN
eukprot:g3682.t1